jgi:hypothetical protein
MSREIFSPGPEVEKLFATSSPSPLCEALGFPSYGFGLALFHLNSFIFFLVATTPIGF